MQNMNRLSKTQKVIALAVAIMARIAGYFIVFNPTAGAKKKNEQRKTDQTIAVLPFTNMSNEPGQEYFSDGLADCILLKSLSIFRRLLIYPVGHAMAL